MSPDSHFLRDLAVLLFVVTSGLTLSGIIANASEKLGESQVRLGAVPEIRGLIEAHRTARIRFQILAKAGVGEIVLVDGTGH